MAPLISPSHKFETHNRNPHTPGILAKAGILTSVSTDAPVCNIQLLRYLTGICIREGMEYNDALKALTSSAAQICGVSDRYGDICEGKEAHFVIWDGDPLKSLQANVVQILDAEDHWDEAEL